MSKEIKLIGYSQEYEDKPLEEILKKKLLDEDRLSDSDDVFYLIEIDLKLRSLDDQERLNAVNQVNVLLATLEDRGINNFFLVDKELGVKVNKIIVEHKHD